MIHEGLSLVEKMGGMDVKEQTQYLMSLLQQNLGDLQVSPDGTDLLGSLFGDGSGGEAGMGLESLMESMNSLSEMMSGDGSSADALSNLSSLLGGDTSDLYSSLMDEFNNMSDAEMEAMLAEP